ncbi:hypothetical protein DX883_12870 [Vibrio fluvialis]|nr:hypothetical protein [Vibrio fluvialis]EKO3996662.1 hypothetical protein [Vibrio fluvialis]
MRINRFKAIPFLLVVGLMSYLSIDGSLGLMDSVYHLGDKVIVNGAFNDASAFAGVVFFVSVFILFFVGFVTGRDLKWIPKIFFAILAGGSVFAFSIGWFVNIDLKQKLNDKGFVECASERELALKYSSRTYVLDPSLCDKL